MATRGRRYLSVTLETLLDDPQLLRHAPAPTATGVYHLETLNLETILMNVNGGAKRDHLGGVRREGPVGPRGQAWSYVRKLVTELSGGVFGYLDSVLERHSFDEFGELI